MCLSLQIIGLVADKRTPLPLRGLGARALGTLLVEDGVAEKVKLEEVMNALLTIAAVEGSDDNTRNARQHAYFCMQIVRPFFSRYP